MKRIILFSALVLALILVSITVQAFTFEKEAINDVVTLEPVNIPAKYSITIKNTNVYDDRFYVYTLGEVRLLPIIHSFIGSGQEKTIIVTLLPYEIFKEERCIAGTICAVQYFIKGEKGAVIEDSLAFRILPLDEIINIKMPSSIDSETSLIAFNISNKKNIDLSQVFLTIDSDFFSTTETINLTPRSSKEIVLEVDKDKIKTAQAGDYIIRFKFLINDEYNHTIEKTLTLEELIDIETTQSKHFSFFSFTNIITKKNNGNSPKLVTVEVTKGRFEKAFTSSNIEPAYEKVDGAITMAWQRELEPGESFSVAIKTNYTIPVIVLIVIIIAVLAIYLTRKPRVIIKKKVYYIKAKGGEFALKLLLLVKNIGSEISEVKCRDTLPRMAKLYERFGVAKPDKIEKNYLGWDFGTLVAGEEKVLSYIIYSKIKPIGTIEIPKATLTYIDSKGKRCTKYSNKLFVLGEPEK